LPFEVERDEEDQPRKSFETAQRNEAVWFGAALQRGIIRVIRVIIDGEVSRPPPC
jgi:hypothetical protein